MKALDCRRLLGGGGPSASQSKKITFNQLGLRPDHKTSRTHTHTRKVFKTMSGRWKQTRGRLPSEECYFDPL